MKLSKTEQDYVKVIYDLGQINDIKLVSLKDLSAQLGVSAPSVTEMAKRIEKKGLIEYQSYKGVKLTTLGNEQALFILKAHRVWECFLVNVLHYQSDTVHLEAEVLEHAVSPQLIERLYTYLGYPPRCPHGRPIPQEKFWYETKKEIDLTELATDVRAEIKKATKEFLSYLQKVDFTHQPRFIKIKEKLADGTYIVQLNDEQLVVLPPFFQTDVQVVVYE